MTELYDQIGTCHLKANTTKQRFPFRVRLAYGLPALIDPERAGNGANSSTVLWLTATGCSAVAGNVAKNQIIWSNNSYPSNYYTQMGLNENASFPATAVNGSLFSWLFYEPSTTLSVGSDIEGAPPAQCIYQTPRPIAWASRPIAASSGNVGNAYWNNV